MKEGLPENCVLACICAESQFQLISSQLNEGTITVMDLEKIQLRYEQMKRLIKAVQKAHSRCDVYHPLNLRLQELRVYHEQKKYLENVCQRIDGKIVCVYYNANYDSLKCKQY